MNYIVQISKFQKIKYIQINEENNIKRHTIVYGDIVQTEFS